jgi:alpha-tubulin suppressor-like RCC1 family protein
MPAAKMRFLILLVTTSALAQGCYLAFGADRFEYQDDASLDAGPRDAGPDARTPDGGLDAAPDADAPACVPDDVRPCPGRTDVGECVAGTESCVAGSWGPCEGAVGPMAEVCDGLDNDCDGEVDGLVADADCGLGQVCTIGTCRVSSCPGNFADCNEDPSDGCESDIRITVEHCGACNTGCDWTCSRATCDDAIAIVAGTDHTCALLEQGGVACWGNNVDGQLGTGAAGPGLRSAVPVRVLGIEGAEHLGGVRSIATGEGHTCAVVAAGEVWCWGRGGLGQLGNGATVNSARPVRVTGIAGATQVTAGAGFSCALLGTGRIQCWGKNSNGSLGDGTTTSRSTPVAVSTISTAVEIAAGGAHACARLMDGTVRCWGANGSGQLGDDTTMQRDRPVAVTSLNDATQLSTRWNHTCVRRSGGTISCWGENGSGQIGNGSTTNARVPVAVPGMSAVVEVRTGTNFTCARFMDATASCWGNNFNGQLGNGSTGGVTAAIPPMPVVGLSSATGLAAGWHHTCAIRTGAPPVCWGRNGDGRLGTGDETQRTTPGEIVPPAPR